MNSVFFIIYKDIGLMIVNFKIVKNQRSLYILKNEIFFKDNKNFGNVILY